MTNRIVTLGALLSLSLAAVACGGAAMPNTQLADAKSALSAARAANAADVPDGALQLKLSDDAIHTAEKRMRDGDDTAAAMLLERAKADADLALLIARESQARDELTKFEAHSAADGVH